MTCGVSFVFRQGTHGAPRVAPGQFSLHSSCEGDAGIALESLQGNQASRCIEGGISRSFLSCDKKSWVPSTCAGDLRGLLMVALRSQGNWRWEGPVGTPLGLVQWKRASSRLEAEPQGSSHFLTWVLGCVCCVKQGVKFRIVWRHGTLLFSQVVKGVSGLQAS